MDSEYNRKIMINISVCMATYNGEKYIKEQIESIIANLAEGDEIVISDDSSTDSTVSLIESINSHYIRLFKNKQRSGIIRNYENAILEAKNEYIFLSDQDDVWNRNKRSVLVKYLESSDLVIHDCYIMHDDKIDNKSIFTVLNSKKGFFHNITKNSYIGCCMAFNKKILKRALPFPADIPMHDWWIGLIAEIFGKIYFCNEKLIKYRRHESNSSNTGKKSNTNVFIKIGYRYRLVKNLLYKIIKILLERMHDNNV